MFYRRWKVVHFDKKAEKGSILFSANHQNSFIDPLLILLSQNKIPVFLTQAGVFQTSALVRAFFNFLFMLPIYRQRDGIKSVAKNEAIMKKCQDYLLGGRHPIGIFTEGTHSFRWTLRPLKKGIARLAFDTLDRNPDLDLKIIPVGLNYTDHIAAQSDVLVVFGNPMRVKPYYEIYLRNKAAGFRQLLDDLAAAMSETMIVIPNDERYEEIEAQWLKSRRMTGDLYADFRHNRKLVEKIINGEPDDGEKVNREKAIRAARLKKMLRIFLFPVWFYGWINNWLSVAMVRKFIGKFVPDPHFHSSMKFIMVAFGIPLIYLLQALVVWAITLDFTCAAIYFISLPFTGFIYFRWLL